ncbi:hypothetical protein, partial [Anaerovibrio slackiae]|uniref:hypothetical protein n=1 Tax=Anaerovibrio slackiae TaxID=2652309 RepID=UPI003867769A
QKHALARRGDKTEKGSACDKALAEAIRALIPLIIFVVVTGVVLLCKLTFTGELILMLRH